MDPSTHLTERAAKALEHMLRGGITFGDLENHHAWMFERGSGMGLRAHGADNLWLWSDMSAAGIAFFEDPEVVARVWPKSTGVLLYAYDGADPGLPAIGTEKPGEDRWAPVVWGPRDN